MTPARITPEQKRQTALLAGIAVASVLLWQTTVGSLVLYPFTILATWFHEMGHGLATMLTGNGFDRLVLFGDGSGYTISRHTAEPWRLTSAFIAAAGPMGPAIAGSLLILASRTDQTTRRALNVLGATLLLSTLVWVRSLVGWAMLPPIALLVLWIARRGSPSHRRFAIQLLGIQACISVWRQFDYLFTPGGYVGGRIARSDTGAMSDVLLLPYWFWGAGISVAIVAMLFLSMRAALRR